MDGKNLRIVFMGTPDFAVESLKSLIDAGYNVVAVVTTPDKPAGRGQKMNESAVKQYAVKLGLPILQPERLKDESFVLALKELKADLQIVVAFRMLPEIVWNMPPCGTVNLHASLLPKYRGAAPLNWAIINGDTESGVTTFKLQQEIDTGNIIFQEKVSIGPDDTVEMLHDRLMMLGADLIKKTVDAIAEGTAGFSDQNVLISKGQATCPAPKIFKEDCKITWTKDGLSIKNLVRGLSPYPAAWTRLVNQETGEETSAKIFKVQFVEDLEAADEVGSIKTDGKKNLFVKCVNGWIAVDAIQLAGKKALPIGQFLLGNAKIAKYRAVE